MVNLQYQRSWIVWTIGWIHLCVELFHTKQHVKVILFVKVYLSRSKRHQILNLELMDPRGESNKRNVYNDKIFVMANNFVYDTKMIYTCMWPRAKISLKNSLSILKFFAVVENKKSYSLLFWPMLFAVQYFRIKI